MRFLYALLILILTTTAAFAQQASTVTLPLGEWIVALLPLLAFIFLVLVIVGLGFLVTLLPPWAQALASTAQQKYLVGLASNAINSALQATAGAVKDIQITVDVGHPLVAKAVQEAIDTWPKETIDKLGGIEGVKKWIIAQLEDNGIVLPPGSTTSEILASREVRAVRP